MAIQLVMRCNGLEYDLNSVPTLPLTYPIIKQLVSQLHEALDATKSIKSKDAILYHKFDSPPDRYSKDFAKLLSIRYKKEEHPLRNFLLQLSLPALLKVSHDHTIRCLKNNKSNLPAFAQYAEKHAKLIERFVVRANEELEGVARASFECDLKSYQGDITCRPEVFVTYTALTVRHTLLYDFAQVSGPIGHPQTETASLPNSQLGDAPNNSESALLSNTLPLPAQPSSDEFLGNLPPPDILNILSAHYAALSKERLMAFLSDSGDASFWIILPAEYKMAPLIQISQEMLGELISFLRS